MEDHLDARQVEMKAIQPREMKRIEVRREVQRQNKCCCVRIIAAIPLCDSPELANLVYSDTANRFDDKLG